jgi:hypothetical protein
MNDQGNRTTFDRIADTRYAIAIVFTLMFTNAQTARWVGAEMLVLARAQISSKWMGDAEETHMYTYWGGGIVGTVLVILLVLLVLLFCFVLFVCLFCS